MPNVAGTARTRAITKLAAIRRHHPDRDTTDLEQNLKEATLAEHITRLVDTAPPLRPEQRERLALLLRGATADRNGGESDA